MTRLGEYPASLARRWREIGYERKVGKFDFGWGSNPGPPKCELSAHTERHGGGSLEMDQANALWPLTYKRMLATRTKPS